MKHFYTFIILLTLTLQTQLATAQALHWLSQPEVDVGLIADNNSDDAKISTNGRYFTFTSKASNLTANDNNRVEDVFIRDKQTGITTLVSITNTNIQATTKHHIKTISAPTSDGRYVAFNSNDIAFEHADGNYYVYVKDLLTGDLTNVSNYNGNSYFEVVSSDLYLSNDGRYLTFSTRSPIDPLQTSNSFNQIFRKDLITNTFELISLSHDGLAVSNKGSELVGMSDSGRYILNSSSSTNLTTDTINNSFNNLFLHDRQLGVTTLVNITPTGSSSSDNDVSITKSEAAVSNSGGVVFITGQSDLVNNDNNNRNDVFYYENGNIIRINLDASGNELLGSTTISVTISGDGSRIAFTEGSNNLFPTSTSDDNQLYAYETSSGTLALISKNTNGDKVNGHSYKPKFSTGGNRFLFTSVASDLTNEPATGFTTNVFYYNFNTAVMKNESVAFATPNTIISYASNPVISSDQMSVIYVSRSPNLVNQPINITSFDLFLLDRNTNTHSRVATNVSTGGGDISPSGNLISFTTSYLPPDGITNLGASYIFVYDRVNDSYTQIEKGATSKVNDNGVVVFTTSEDFDANDSNGLTDLYAYNPTSQNITLISKQLDGFASSFASTVDDFSLGGISGDIWVAFSSSSDSIVVNDVNGERDIFLKNIMNNNPITRITKTLLGAEANGASYDPAISENGNWIAFTTFANNLTNDDYSTADSEQIVVFDRINHAYTLASINDFSMPVTSLNTNGVSQPSISNTGRYISYIYQDRDANNVENKSNDGFQKLSNPDFSGDTDALWDVILFDTYTQTPKLISKHIEGTQSNDEAFEHQVVEDLNSVQPKVGVIFLAEDGDLTSLSSHPGHKEVYLYQQNILLSDLIFANGFE